MKKIILSAVIALSTLGICVANSGTSKAQTSKTSYVVRDTVPSDTTKPMDSTLLMK